MEDEDPLDEIRLRVHDAMHSSPRGLNQSTVARETGMSTDALSRSLNGQRNFSASELARLANVFEVSLGWLITGDPRPDSFVDESKDPLPWRRDQIAETVAFPAGAYREVGLDTGSVPLLDPDTTPESAAGLVAENLGRNLDRPFIHDLPAAIEESYGIGVFVSAEGPDFDARAMRVRGLTYIVVRATGAWYQANLVLARELGELLSGGHLAIGLRSQHPDNWSNDFALALLMPAPRLRSIDWNRQTPRELAEFLWESGVSAKALMRRLDGLGIPRGPAWVHADEGTLQLLVWQDPDCLSHDRARAYRSPRIPFDLFSAHLKGMREGRVDGTSLAWMLDTPLAEL
ncbi:helix-turn-helix domain-containing protein [Paeniglutamicibacter sp. NPDC012692]|uniref:helix-turn-helix domain-containing protein n=1 Tax=Paeniglutamicibacter sp. NPDC012692 TaxID=3364388 RepID=UPI00367B4810